MKVLAILLIAVGVVVFARGGFSYKTEETLIDAGPVELTTEETHRVSLPPVLGALAIAAGVGLLVLDRKH